MMAVVSSLVAIAGCATSHRAAPRLGLGLASVRRRAVCAQATSTSGTGGLLLSVERAVGAVNASDCDLWNTKRFQFGVHPDLPIATTWQGLARALTRPSPPSPPTTAAPANSDRASTRVSTVAVNLKSHSKLREQILDISKDGRSAAALLCVSGSHPVRSIPGVNRCLKGSRDALQLARSLRASGDIPSGTQLWAVENPVLETNACRLEGKVASGAAVVLTQPPLAWNRFQAWMGDAVDRGLADECKLVIGVPMLTSPANLRFWVQLCGAAESGEQGDLLDKWMAADASSSRDDFYEFALNWNRELIGQVKSTPGVSGLHVMPFGKKGREMTMKLIADGTL